MAGLTAAERLANTQVVLATYRHLLRAINLAFKGDDRTHLEARKFARKSFNDGRTEKLGGQTALVGVQHAQGVTKILRENVVQGTLSGTDTYKVNIRRDTELGDNDTAGKLKGTTRTFKDIKDSTF